MKFGFIFLTAFSSIGGIQKFNKIFLNALCDIKKRKKNFDFKALSLHDDLPEERYICEKSFQGFNNNKIKFFFQSVKLIVSSDFIIIGHINLYPIGFLCFLLRKKYFIVAHGIEVWSKNKNLESFVLKNADGIFSVSNFTKDKLIKIHNLNPEKINIVFNTVDPFFTKSIVNFEFEHKKEPAEKLFTILSVCRLSSDEKYKGYDKVIKSLPVVKKRHKDIKYVIVGKSDEKELRRINNLAESLDVKSNLVLAGEVKEDQLADYYSSADVFVLPSKGEGFGIVFLEALYFGLPVIAGNVDGSVDPLMNGELGILVNPDDVNQIADSITNVISNNKFKSTDHKKYLREKVVENFGYESFRENIYNLLNWEQ